MVIKKRQDNGLNGFVVPSIPKAPRSARRPSVKKELEGDEICGFDLLAAVAGQLLQENENSSDSSNETETEDLFASGKGVKPEQQCLDRLSDAEYFNNMKKSEGLTQAESDISMEHVSALSSSDCPENVEVDLKLGTSERKDVSPNLSCKTKAAHFVKGPYDAAERIEIKEEKEVERVRTKEIFQGDSHLSKHEGHAPFLPHRGNITTVSRHGFEKHVQHSLRNGEAKAMRSPSYARNSRFRKYLGYKYWKVSPELRGYDSCADEGIRHACYNRKTYHGRDRSVQDSPVKKRKLYDQSSVVTSDRGISCESCSDSDQICANIKKSPSNPLLYGVKKCSSKKRHQAAGQARDSQVRLCIRSFKVPELLVEVPLTATVASLKATVLEAVSSVLRGGLNVEVVVRGKKIKDDNNTLMQSGISQNENLESLGFMLEPSSPQAPSPVCHDRVLLPCDQQKQSKRSFTTVPISADEPSPMTNLGKKVVVDHNLVPVATDVLQEDSLESKALALFPVTNAEPLAMVTANQKGKRSELAQRRTRRPFSVTEVEALVRAVEELGTGRWRDVKVRSFDNAEHRTYVDLKDKWKTLVHTAQIAPQQRRGEPVPQELLDRVLAAHAYWTEHHQVRSNSKPQFILAA